MRIRIGKYLVLALLALSLALTAALAVPGSFGAAPAKKDDKGKAPVKKDDKAPAKKDDAKKDDAKKDDKPAPPVTEEAVNKAIEKGRQWLIRQAKADGSFATSGNKGGLSALAFMTLAYMGEHPNQPHMSKGLDFLLDLNAETGFQKRQGYAVPIRIMGLSYVHNKLLGDKRALIRQKMAEDLLRIELGQNAAGGWRYELNATDYDFSVEQWPILAMREANNVGVEFKTAPLIKARKLYYDNQNKDNGGWAYIGGKDPYGSMTAAGLASIYIIADVLEPASGCPCRGGQSQARAAETERRIDRALDWLGKNFKADNNPGKGGRSLYWLYCVERVGIAAGYKYFGAHNWFKEGAGILLKEQGGDGNWGGLDDTCFALLFLYKGRAPILMNKLKFDGEWNPHRRDAANLVAYAERTIEQQFHWQIVDLKAPLAELHEAPILYICAETVPEKWGDAEKKKLRAFTDSGGTILVEASCGNAAVKKWFVDFAKDIWPEWQCGKLANDHDIWKAKHDLKERPEIWGLSDGVRTPVFYSPDDISCAWQTRAVVGKEYLFKWGINLHTYATDAMPLRGKLEAREVGKSTRYTATVKGGGKDTVKVARVVHGGNWAAGANYGGLKDLAEIAKSRAGVTLDVKEPRGIPSTEGGVAAGDLKGFDVAYLAGSTGISFKPEEQAALKDYVAGGGFLWAEAVTGATAFDQPFRKLLGDLGWELRLLPATHPLVTGKMDKGAGYSLFANVQFTRALRVMRLSRPQAEYHGIFAGDKLIGIYSPFDICYSMKPYQAYNNRGYQIEDAEAAGINLAIFFSTLK